jgi:retron-type reverse transcriptase
LREINNTWTGTVWFVEGDISDCFGSLDHEILLSIMAEKIKDQRFLRLIRNMLKAGYLEDWDYHEMLSGCPQGGVVSPILSNIYLHKLDEFVEQELIPQYTRGTSRLPADRAASDASECAGQRRPDLSATLTMSGVLKIYQVRGRSSAGIRRTEI